MKGNGKIKVYTGAKVEKISGGPGVFNATISQNGTQAEHQVGAIVLAAGWQPYDPAKLDPKLGFGASPNVITNAVFEESFKGAPIARPSDGKNVSSVAFLQCAGSETPIISPTARPSAARRPEAGDGGKDAEQDANAYVVFKEMRTPGQAEDLYRKAQERG